MEIGKTTWRVMLAAINAYNDGEYSHCSTGELREKFGRFKHRRTNVKEYTLTEEYIEQQLLKQELKDYYTGIISDDYKEYSIDRIDSNLGYIEGNIVITTNKINVMKSNMTIDEFKEQIKLLYNNLNNF